MGLRRRLLLALTSMLIVLALVLVGAGLAIRSYLISQVDARLLALAHDGKQLVAMAQRAASGTAGPATALVSDVWVGVEGPGGKVTVIQTPSSDASLTPVLDGREPLDEGVNRVSVGGDSGLVRVVTSTLGDKRRVLVAVPLRDVNGASGRLTLVLGLAWLVVAGASILIAAWADRLGLRPIEAMTSVARSITAQAGRGRPIGERVPVGRPGTEASELGAALNSMLDATEAASERQRQFVADASHELRTPLTSLRGYSALYAAGALSTPEQVADAMRRINAEATRMSGLVEAMFDLSTLEAGQPLTLSTVDVGQVLRDVASDLRAAAPERAVEVDAPSGLVAHADSGRLTQAVLALGTNALRHGRGRVLLRGSQTGGGGVRIEVTDEGPGIPDDQLDAIFARFHRAAASGVKGSGLGLPLVAAIGRAHGGQCGVSSAFGDHSTFWIELPAQSVH